MKKHILFVIDSLGVGGAEKSLVTLLNLIDYSRYEVDLQLFAYGRVFEQFLPKSVNVLPPLDYSQFLEAPLWKQILHPRKVFARLTYSIFIRKGAITHAERAVVYLQIIGKTMCPCVNDYDVAIGYGQCLPSLYVIDKCTASRKFLWVNCIFNLEGPAKSYHQAYYEKADGIACVSHGAKNKMESLFPHLSNRMYLIPDLYDSNIISRMSFISSDKTIDNSFPVIMTTGRLNKPQKGYDLALAAAKELRDRGVKFRWYAVGEGPYRSEMEAYIKENQLEDVFILLGATANPYAYMRQCDVYVQTSRHEGFGLTIAEARILNRPVVCTNFEASSMQMKDGMNGLVVEMTPKAIADGIERFLTDKQLYENVKLYLKSEKKGNTEEIRKFYQLIEC